MGQISLNAFPLKKYKYLNEHINIYIYIYISSGKHIFVSFKLYHTYEYFPFDSVDDIKFK